MTTRTRFIGYVTVAATVCAFISADAAMAQGTPGKRLTQALALENKAEGMRDVPTKWLALAGALEHAARLRGATDPQGIKDLMYAATVRAQVGDVARAQSEYVQAAQQALAIGDVETAATGYIRGAAVAAALKDAAAAQDFRDRAARLALSPLLNETQRAAILGRVGTATE